jgi:hypothetical protein
MKSGGKKTKPLEDFTMHLNKLLSAWLLACIAVLLVSCTLAEWGRVGEDALKDAPEVVTDVVANPTPVGIGLAIAAFISGLFAKSAARNFGKVAKGTGNKVYDVTKQIIDAVSKKTEPPSEPPVSST